MNIADPTTPSHEATVSAAGQLQVGGAVAPAAPKLSFFGAQYVETGNDQTLIPATKATLALTRLSLENDFGNAGEAESAFVFQVFGSTTTCDGSGGDAFVGLYDVQPGQTFADSIGSPIVLAPASSNHVWCLEVFVSLEGNPGSYYEPAVQWSGYTVSGTPPAMPVGRSEPGTPPRHTTG